MAPGHARQLINGLRAQRFVAELQSSQELAPTAGHLQWRQIPGTCRCGHAGNAPTQEEQRGCCRAPICFSSCRSTLEEFPSQGGEATREKAFGCFGLAPGSCWHSPPRVTAALPVTLIMPISSWSIHL